MGVARSTYDEFGSGKNKKGGGNLEYIAADGRVIQ
jgi:hypothetical protein